MADEPILRMPGEWLAETRKAAGLSLAEVAERTKIPPRMLESIERDEYHKLSGPLYTKSFLRAYAVEVGLDVEEILDLYARMSGEAGKPSATGQTAVPEAERVTISRVGVPWWRIAGLSVIGATLVTVLVLALRGCGGDGPPESTVAVPPETLPESAQAPPAGAATPADSLPPAVAAAQDPVPEPGRESAEQAAAAAAAARSVGDAATDSLAAGWVASPPPEPTGRQAEATAPAPEPRQPAASRAHLPRAIASDGPVPFAGGQRWPLVLRVICAEPVGVRVRRDAEPRYGAADFAAGEPPPLPGRDLVPGRAYAVRGGYAVYWGAEDHFLLQLDDTRGVSVSVAGRDVDVSRLRPDQEKLLDAHR